MTESSASAWSRFWSDAHKEQYRRGDCETLCAVDNKWNLPPASVGSEGFYRKSFIGSEEQVLESLPVAQSSMSQVLQKEHFQFLEKGKGPFISRPPRSCRFSQSPTVHSSQTRQFLPRSSLEILRHQQGYAFNLFTFSISYRDLRSTNIHESMKKFDTMLKNG